jgi:FkbM family methyltransferase
MRRLLRQLLEKIGRKCSTLAEKIYQSPEEARKRAEREKKRKRDARAAPWFEIRGDKTLRLEYDLDETSLVFDLGGYEGQWASDIFSKYCCKIYVFETVSEFADRIKARFSKNKKIYIFPFGLASNTKQAKVSLNSNGSSLFTNGREYTTVNLIRVIDFVQKHNILRINLMKINIEGGEYDLLEHLIESGFIKNIENIQVQFHDIIPKAEQRMKKIQAELEKTHFLIPNQAKII